MKYLPRDVAFAKLGALEGPRGCVPLRDEGG
jgi:hypothetical protein